MDFSESCSFSTLFRVQISPFLNVSACIRYVSNFVSIYGGLVLSSFCQEIYWKVSSFCSESSCQPIRGVHTLRDAYKGEDRKCDESILFVHITK